MLVHNHVTSYPSTADKILVCFVGFADTVGNAGCYKVYNPETGQVLYRDSQGVGQLTTVTPLRDYPMSNCSMASRRRSYGSSKDSTRGLETLLGIGIMISKVSSTF